MWRQYIMGPDGSPVPCEDTEEWARWFEEAERQIDLDVWPEQDVKVSTIFLGLDHAFGGGPPILWETMVFGGSSDMEQERYTSLQAAITGHKVMVERVKETLK